MKLLAIESSCDETAAAVSRNGREIRSDVVYSQAEMHALYGGVVPEIASGAAVAAVRLEDDRTRALEAILKKSRKRNK